MSTISDDVRDKVMLCMSTMITGPVTLVGVIANVINFVILLKQGVKDCVSVCLLALTISDFGSVLIGGTMVSFNILRHLGVDHVIHYFAFTFVMTYGCAMAYDISQGIIAFIALERCLCVAMPLKFRDLFTFWRSLFVVIFLYAFTIAAYIPHFVTSGLHWRHDPVTNSSRIFVWVSGNRVEIDFYLNTFMHVTVATLYEIIVMVSTQVMVIGLRRSSKFRKRTEKAEKVARSEVSLQVSEKHAGLQSSSDREAVVATTKDDQTNNLEWNRKGNHPKDDSSTKHCPRNDETSKDQKARRNPTKNTSSTFQNRRVIKTVSAIAVIFLVCNAVRLASIYTNMSNPDLGYFKRYHNEVVVVNLVVFVFQTANSSANILVYYHFNPSFRTIFKSIFCRVKMGQ